MGDLEDHLTKCESSPVTCPNKCKVDHLQLLRKSLKDHLETKCPNRAYSCEHCGLRGKYASIVGEHDGECEKKLISCPNTECGLTMERGEIKEHIESVCKFTEVPCKYHRFGCNIQKRRISMNQHEEEDDKAHLRMSLEMISKLDSTLTLQMEKTVKLDRALTLQMEKTAKLDSTLSSMKINSNALGTITFKVSEYGRKREGDIEFYSEPFYTSPGGYKMCVRVDPNGYSEAQGSHVSVFIKLLEGPNDESLHWPFLGTVKVELLNQLADSGHHVRTLTMDTEDDARLGKTWGYPKFLPHSKLSHDSARSTQYLMDDTLYFRVTVEDPKPWLVCTHPST